MIMNGKSIIILVSLFAVFLKSRKVKVHEQQIRRK
jgi:hypothetical protein